MTEERFCVVRDYGTENENIIASGLTDHEMLVFVKENLRDDGDKLTVCMENATEKYAEAWCNRALRRANDER